MVAESESLVRFEPGLPTALEAREWLDRTFAAYDVVAPSAEQLVEMMPQLGDEDVHRARMYAQALFRASWLIEIAADYEILHRMRLRGGRGKKDVLGEGRMSAYDRAAKAAGVHRNTIMRNAQMHQVFFVDAPETILDVQDSLVEKSYLEEALRADDPYTALKVFVEMKKADPSFTAKDARRWVQVGDVEEVRRQIIPSLACLIEDSPNKPIWEKWLAATKELRTVEPMLQKPLNDCERDLRDQISRPTHTVEERICFLLRENPGMTCEALTPMLGLDRPQVQAVLDVLERENRVRKVSQFDSKTKLVAARGANVWLYFFNWSPGRPTAPEYEETLDPSSVDEFGDEI
jgi:hypothetical protein